MSSQPYTKDEPMPTDPSADRQKAIEIRWEERRLFFWTVREVLLCVRQILLCIVLTALTVFMLVSLVEGQPPGTDLLLRYLSH